MFVQEIIKCAPNTIITTLLRVIIASLVYVLNYGIYWCNCQRPYGGSEIDNLAIHDFIAGTYVI